MIHRCKASRVSGPAARAVAALLMTCASIGALGGAPARARDLGVRGETFPILEPNIIVYLKSRLQAAQASGKVEDLNRQFASRSRAHIMRPVPVAGLEVTTVPRSWTFDPAIVVRGDIRDVKGHVFAHTGDVVNPLQHMHFDRVLVFIDGDRPDQVSYAEKLAHSRGEARTRIILTNGSPIELMRTHRLQFYFDQSGRLSAHFRLTHVPTVVEPAGDVLRISEVAP